MVKKIKEAKKDVVTLYKNLQKLIESAALLIVAVFAIYGSYNYQLNQTIKYALLIAGVIIGLRGAWELLRHLAEKDK